MKRIVLLAALAAVSACSKTEPAPEPAETTEAPVAEVATTAADGGPSTGKFEVTQPDGSKFVVEVKPDGTYAVWGTDGTVTETGKWEQKSPELWCETPDKEGATQKCFTEAVDANGVYTSTDPDTGEVATVVRLDG